MMDANNWAGGKADFPNDIYNEIVQRATDSDPANRYNSVATMIIEFQSATKRRKWIQDIYEDKRIIVVGHIWNALVTVAYILASAFVIYLAATPEIDLICPLTVAEKIIYSAMTISSIESMNGSW